MIHFQVRHLMGVLECHQLIAVPITTGKKRYSRLSVVTPFQLRPKKKRYSCLAIIRCAVPIAIVAPFQLRPENKKDTVICPLLRHSNYNQKKKIQLSGHHSLRRSNCHFYLRRSNYDRKKKDTVICPLLRHLNYNRKKKILSSGHHLLCRSNCHCCTVPITTRKKRYSRLSVVTLFQIRPEKKNLAGTMIHFQVRHLMGVLKCHQLIAVPVTTGKKKIQPSFRCYAIPITTGKKRYSCLAIIRCAVPIAIVAPFQLRPKKKKIQSSVHCYAIPITTRKNNNTVVSPSFAAPFQLPLLVAPFQL
jgi:hypothetical protein